jgi:hypothetical protein
VDAYVDISPLEGIVGSSRRVLINSRPSSRSVGEDVLENLQNYKKEASSGMTPAGVKASERDIRVGAMPPTRRPVRNMAVFTSVDGTAYTFRTHDTKGKELPHNRMQMLFICLREISLGGDALAVFKAFRVNMKDVDGRQFFPFSEETLQAIHLREVGHEELTEDEDLDEGSTFALGEEED